MRSDLMPGAYLFVKPYKTKIGKRHDWETGFPRPKVANDRVWFTDGSLINGKAGYGAHRILPRCNLIDSLGRFCTVFLAEVFAILACVQQEVVQGTKNKQIYIYSDSQAALKALDNCFFAS